MINLERSKDKKWIFQKNINSSKLIEAYVKVINETKDIDKESIKNLLKRENGYKGRSSSGSLSTMGVRFSQMCFYMFGYKSGSVFMPSQTTVNMINSTSAVNKNMLVNLFSIQYPHPYSKTSTDFRIYAGRLIIKLLTEERIGCKLYIDEFVWFLPFLKKINIDIYEELISSILEYRELTYEEKYGLFKSVKNYTDVFSNCLHEINYYFIKIFKGFGVFKSIPDRDHNNSKIFKFKHGNTNTFRSDKISSEESCSGYIALEENVVESAKILVSKFSPFDNPTSMADSTVYTKSEWITDLYENELIEYLDAIFPDYNKQREIINAVSNMTYMSKYSPINGKEFEKSLESVFQLFREALSVEVISGAGDTDILCTFEDLTDPSSISNLYKVNVDGKSRKSSLNLNPMRLIRHLQIHSSKYCIVVAPRFARATKLDIYNQNIVLIDADTLATYCKKECFSNPDSSADFSSINEIIINNLGTDISDKVNKLIDKKYGIKM